MELKRFIVCRDCISSRHSKHLISGYHQAVSCSLDRRQD
jgi:hypothetical protein